MMQVIKRSGQREEVSFDKITARLRKMSYGLDTGFVNIIEVSKKVIMGLYDGVTTVELRQPGSRNRRHYGHHSP